MLDFPSEEARKRRVLFEAENARRKRGANVDRHGRTRVDLAGEGEVWLGGLTPLERRNSFALGENIKHLAGIYGIERLGFLTLTFAENVKDPKIAQRRFNSLASNYLRTVFTEYICVVEAQKRGAVHYHLLVVCAEDIRSGVDFDELAARVYRSAGPYLRGLWKDLRESMPSYGFGRSELLPVRSTVSGITNYVGKYMSKASAHRGEHMKGARLVRYSKGWRVANCRFAWVSDGAMDWRARVAEWAAANGCETMEDLADKRGKRWAWELMALRTALKIEGVEYSAFLDDWKASLERSSGCFGASDWGRIFSS